MGQNEVQLGTCWGTCWEHIGNLIKILWKHIGNMLGTWGTCWEPIRKLIEHIKNNKNPINTFIPFPPPEGKKWVYWMHATNFHWRRIFNPNNVDHLFWPWVMLRNIIIIPLCALNLKPYSLKENKQCWRCIRKKWKLAKVSKLVLTLNITMYHTWCYLIWNLTHQFSLDWELATWKLVFEKNIF